jgi:hypothetical protein
VAEIRDRASFVIDWTVADTSLVQIATEDGHVFLINLHIMGGRSGSSLVIHFNFNRFTDVTKASRLEVDREFRHRVCSKARLLDGRSNGYKWHKSKIDRRTIYGT